MTSRAIVTTLLAAALSCAAVARAQEGEPSAAEAEAVIERILELRSESESLLEGLPPELREEVERRWAERRESEAETVSTAPPAEGRVAREDAAEEPPVSMPPATGSAPPGPAIAEVPADEIPRSVPSSADARIPDPVFTEPPGADLPSVEAPATVPPPEPPVGPTAPAAPPDPEPAVIEPPSDAPPAAEPPVGEAEAELPAIWPPPRSPELEREPAAPPPPAGPGSGSKASCGSLSALDRNDDGLVDGSDRDWRYLYLWLGGRGVPAAQALDREEVASLFDLGVRSLSVDLREFGGEGNSFGDVVVDQTVRLLLLTTYKGYDTGALAVDAGRLARGGDLRLVDTASGETLAGLRVFRPGVALEQADGTRFPIPCP